MNSVIEIGKEIVFQFSDMKKRFWINNSNPLENKKALSPLTWLLNQSIKKLNFL